MSEETKTLREWAASDCIRIIEPDGFDRSDPNLMERQFTHAEYEAGIMYCNLESI